MPISNTSLVERIARILAGREVSINADGQNPSAAERVDEIWRAYRADALSVIRTLREPDPAMAQAGDLEIWERMIEAAIVETEAALEAE
jgi:hypothetical protein